MQDWRENVDEQIQTSGQCSWSVEVPWRCRGGAVEAVGNEAASWPDETRHLGLGSKAVLTVALCAGELLEQ